MGSPDPYMSSRYNSLLMIGWLECIDQTNLLMGLSWVIGNNETPSFSQVSWAVCNNGYQVSLWSADPSISSKYHGLIVLGQVVPSQPTHVHRLDEYSKATRLNHVH